ncbi:polymerase [Variovorax sp. Root318D1]|uniref:PglL family O-oligosaccharyltransferase n=1 Tax=Variovorax sp. Root318D1 TaxID=1736513 RepID=UPI0007001C5B|nr:Wzy polymerase domain-containing protein [Variovorax sp. Root318D1]KQU82894.1 polymerase [Variovorax sp. Root318D1]
MTSRTAPLEAAVLPSKTIGAVRAGLVAFPFLCPLVAGPSVQAWQLFATWVCVAALLLAIPPGAPARVVWAWLAAGMAAIVLSSFFSASHAAAAASWLPAVVVLGAMGAAACVGAGMARGGPSASAALGVGILVAGLVSAVLGLLQYYGLAEPLVPWTTTPALGQAYGNLRQRNQFATLISMALVAALWIHATQPSVRVRRWLVAAALLLLVAAAASTSRTGLLQLLSIVGVSALIAWRERRGVAESAPGDVRFSLPPPWLLLAMIPIYFAIAWLLPQLAAGEVEGMMRRLQEGAPGDHTRLILWRNVLTLIAQHPLAGWGWGELSFAHYSTLYDGPRFPEILDNAHNLPLHLAVELGIPVSVLICGGFAWMVLAARPWWERDPARLMAWGVLGAIVLHSLLEYPLWYGPFQLAFGLCLGMLWPARRQESSSLRQRGKGRWGEAPILPLAAAGVLMGAVGYATWDYIRISQVYLTRDERLPSYEENTLTKAKSSWLFARQVGFAELTLTAVTPANAAALHSLAERTLHFSPEPRVIVKLIESAELMGQRQEARDQAERFRIAFPEAYERWLNGQSVEADMP